MIPCCRTLEGADRVLAVMAEHGLVRGENGRQVDMMAAILSNAMLAEECAQRFDGFSMFVAFLVEAGIDSISLYPGSVIAVKQDVANAEKRVG